MMNGQMAFLCVVIGVLLVCLVNTIKDIRATHERIRAVELQVEDLTNSPIVAHYVATSERICND